MSGSTASLAAGRRSPTSADDAVLDPPADTADDRRCLATVPARTGRDRDLDRHPGTADWAETASADPASADSDDPWFYSQQEPAFEVPDDVDDDIMDDVDDFHHDG